MSKEPKKVFGITLGKKDKGGTTATITEEEKASFVYTPEIPIVNVIPTSVFEKYQIKGILRKLGVAALCVAVVLGGGYAGGKFLIAQENSKLNDISTELSQISSESTALTPYQAYQMAVDSKRTALNGIVGSDVNMGVIYAAILKQAGDHGLDLADINVKQYDDPNAPESSCIDPDPFATVNSSETIIGCITIKGGTPSKDATNAFLHGLEETGGVVGDAYRNPFISSFSSSDSANPDGDSLPHSFEGSISFTSALYTDKYIDLGTPLAELLVGGDTQDDPAGDPVEPTEPAEDTNQSTDDENVDIALPSAGPLGQFALTVAESLTPEEVRNVDTMGYAACVATPFSTDNFVTALSAMLEDAHPDLDATTVATDIAAFIEPNCPNIISTEEKNN